MSQITITQDRENKTVTVKRSFAAPRSKVWQAWTDVSLLEKWWAPKPWKAVTKTYEFKPNGQWLYYMAGPDGEQFWSVVKFQEINAEHYFTAIDGFCDENGEINHSMPSDTHWKNEFFEEDGMTHLVVTLTFASEETMQKMIEMQFEGGFSIGLSQLEELLQD
jgi:uncharacterized protein YndB with AHSA1/START domain